MNTNTTIIITKDMAKKMLGFSSSADTLLHVSIKKKENDQAIMSCVIQEETHFLQWLNYVGLKNAAEDVSSFVVRLKELQNILQYKIQQKEDFIQIVYLGNQVKIDLLGEVYIDLIEGVTITPPSKEDSPVVTIKCNANMFLERLFSVQKVNENKEVHLSIKDRQVNFTAINSGGHLLNYEVMDIEEETPYKCIVKGDKMLEIASIISENDISIACYTKYILVQSSVGVQLRIPIMENKNVITKEMAQQGSGNILFTSIIDVDSMKKTVDILSSSTKGNTEKFALIFDLKNQVAILTNTNQVTEEEDSYKISGTQLKVPMKILSSPCNANYIKKIVSCEVYKKILNQTFTSNYCELEVSDNGMKFIPIKNINEKAIELDNSFSRMMFCRF